MIDASELTRLRAMLDKQDIHDNLMRYCRGVDRRDRELMLSAYHPDAIDDHGTPLPVDEFTRNSVARPTATCMHFIGNEYVELEGDIAFCETYFVSFQSVETDGKQFTRSRGGRYLDRVERRAGVWKIAYRLMVDDWARLDEVVAIPKGVGVHHSERSKDDAVYSMREILKVGAH